MMTVQQRREVDEAVGHLTRGAMGIAYGRDSEPYGQAWGELQRLLDAVTDWSTAPAPVRKDA